MSIFREGSKIHLIGIAGSGMNGIARILLARGYEVSGSDEKSSAVLDSLAALGASTFIGHRKEHVVGADYVVVSSAIPDSNPELIAARANGVEILARAEALARLLPGRFSIAVAGTHGKTTTSGMLAQSLTMMGRDPSFVIGSTIRALGESAREGEGSEFVVEADESDGSFLHYRPKGAIITNIELDHVDNFHDVEEIVQLFTDFAATVSDFVVVCGDDERAASLPIPDGIQRISYGTRNDCDLILEEIEESGSGVAARVRWKGESIGQMSLRVPGRHNALNAAAVLAASLAMGLEPTHILTALSQFEGTSRRFEFKGEARGVTVIDDYGHHPTEISATIEAARGFHTPVGSGPARLGIVFQPHRFSRTAAFADEFIAALSKAERVFLLEIYSAGEEPIAGVSSRVLASRMANGELCSDFDDAVAKVDAWCRPGDLILTLGAGDVTKLGPLILKALEG